jgi:cell wall assembly regulator SMI1
MDISSWIKQMLTVREEMCSLDFKKLYRYCPPNKGCSQEDIRRAEARLGVRLDAQYADFLRYANGWREFFGDISLFGTQELAGSPELDMARELLELVYPLNPHLAFQKEDLLPIAIDEAGRGFFVLAPSARGGPGAVIWFAGQEVERYASFHDFLRSILQYNIDDLEESFKGRA